MSDLTPFKYGKRKIGSRNNWEDLQNPYVIENKPVIFIFGGNLTISTQEANGYAKLIGSSFKQFTASIADIISVSYEGEIAEQKGSTIELSSRAKTNASDFFNSTIYESLKDAKNEEKIRSILKKIIFVGHSAGTNVIDLITKQIENYLLYRFNEDQTKVNSVMGDIQCFCYAPGTAIKQNVTAFYVSPFYDKEGKWKKLLFETKGEIRTQYPEGFDENFDPLRPISYTKNALEKNKFVAIRRGLSLILITDKLSDKNDHSIACLKNSNTKYSTYVSGLCESVLNSFLLNSLHDTNYSFHDVFNSIKHYVRRTEESNNN